MREKSIAIRFHYDGLSMESSYGGYSCRLSNVPANLSWATLGVYNFVNYVGVNSLQFIGIDLNSNQHYILKKVNNEDNLKLAHVWKNITENNICNFSKDYLLNFDVHRSYSSEPCRSYGPRDIITCQGELRWGDYIYHKVLNWKDAELFQRWLEPANKTMENCISSFFEIATKPLNETETTTSTANLVNVNNLIYLGIFSVSAAVTYGYLNKKQPASSSNIQPNLGKPNVRQPSFAERIKDLGDDIEIPKKFICPISRQLMEDPILLDDGWFYDRLNVENYLKLYKYNAACPQDDSIRIIIRPYPTACQLQSEINGYIEGLEANQASLKT